MIFSDIIATFQWWLVLFSIGIAVLPLTTQLFRSFFDRGYIFAKIFGIALMSYIIFLLGIFHIPFTTLSTYCVLIGLGVLSYSTFFIRKKNATSEHAFFSLIGKAWKPMLITEILFLCALFFLAYIRSFAPEIHGLEKYMDFGFINSLLRSQSFPPKDMWFTPHTINYYYFGHLVAAVLTKLSGLPSYITYNLMLAAIFAFCFTASFSIGSNLYSLVQGEKVRNIKRFISGLLTALLVTLAGNLHILYAFFKPYENEYPVPLWNLLFSPLSFPNSYWYPNATRFIHNTIHEFPMYSWIVSDLHGHVLDIPLVLLMIAVLLSLFMKNTRTDLRRDKNMSFWQGTNVRIQNLLHISNGKMWYLPLLGFLLAVMYMTNAWDGMIYLLLVALVLSFITIHKHQKTIERKHGSIQHILAKKPLVQTGISIGVVLVSFFIFSLPFNVFFNASQIVSGVGVLQAPSFLLEKKPQPQMFDRRPMLSKIFTPDHCVSLMSKEERKLVNTSYEARKIGPFLFEPDHCQHSPWWQLLMLYGFFFFFVISLLIFLLRSKEMRGTDVFVLLLMLLSTILILIPEFFYVKDIYPEHYRANTMFKLVFQAFIMLSLASAYTIMRITSTTNTKRVPLARLGFLLATPLILALVLTYPYLGLQSYYGELKNYQGLNGIRYLQKQYPTDFAAIQWINVHITGQPVILEAQGDSYTDFARVSANTGLPTVLGWTVHEWLWRGTYDIPAPRIAEVQSLYENPNSQTIKNLLKKYDVKYVFVGDLERQKYPNLNEQKFEQLGKIVFQQGNTKIYKLR